MFWGYWKHILQEANLLFLEDADRTDNLNKIGMQENGWIFACLQSVNTVLFLSVLYQMMIIIAESCTFEIFEPRVFTSNYHAVVQI